jgi:hypothetical protein
VISVTVRADIEQAILDEEHALEQVAGLLEAGTELAGWPDDLRTALVLALTDPAMSRTEGWKAVTLRRHLFGPADQMPGLVQLSREPSVVDHKRAERLRVGIAVVVRYRAGMHLLLAT